MKWKQWVLIFSLCLGLAGCGTASNTSTETDTAKDSGSSSETKSEKKTDSTSETKSEDTSSETQSTETAAPTSDSQTTETSAAMDLNACIAGDFSSVAGTWQNAYGDTLTFNNTGLVSDTYDMTYTGPDGTFNLTVKNGIGGAGLMMIPAGTPDPAGTTYTEDVMFVGQDFSPGMAPYYRVSE